MAIPRKYLLTGGAVAAAGAFFASGALVAAALLDPGDDEPATIAPGVPTGANTQAPAFERPASLTTNAGYWAPAPGGDDAIAFGGRGGGFGSPEAARMVYDKSFPAYYCPGTIEPSVVGATIDPSLAGFSMSLLGEGYTLQSIALRAEGDCDEQGNATSSRLVLDTTWRHNETGFDVVVTQRAGADPVGNILYVESAEFSSGGYNYNVFINSYRYYAEADIRQPQDGPDPRVRGVLIETVSRLAPGFDQQCFYTQRQGDWSDLAALGIGDPRGALPAGLQQNWFSLFVLDDPARDCGGPEPTAAGSQAFNVSYNDASGGWVGIDVYRLWPGQPAYPGYSDSYSLSWTNGNYQFSVYGNRNGEGLGQDALIGIARALDPQFSAQCLVTERLLSVDEFVALGFHAPALPGGFTVVDSRFAVNGLPAGCDVPDDYQVYTSYYGNWTLRGEDGTEIGVSVNRTDGAPVERMDPPGYVGPNSLWWTGADGSYYSIWASTTGINPTVDADLLAGIATSIDPSLDIDSLGQMPADGGVPVKPLPAR